MKYIEERIKGYQQATSFVSRLQAVSHPQRATPWGKSIGLSNNMTTRMFNGEIPSWDALSAIMRKENVSIAWLVEGKGSPFIVSHFDVEQVLVRSLYDQLMTDYPWRVYLLGDSEQLTCMVLVRPSRYQFKEKTIQYEHIDIFAGPIGIDVSKTLTNLQINKAKLDADFILVYHQRLHHEFLQCIRTGWISYEDLFGDHRGRAGLLNSSRLLHGEHIRFAIEKYEQNRISKVREQRVQYALEIDRATLKDVIAIVEEEALMRHYQLDYDKKARSVTAIYRLARRTGDSVEKLRQTVVCILEVM